MAKEQGDTAIKAIDKTTVHRICSGQVVLNLATAVKELVENAIDAGSTSVEVRLKEYGSESIEVSDNGKGVHPNDFEGLTLKHHTSKLRDFSDLISVETFGFRGEALSSLCALCDLSVVTRHQSQDCATSLAFDRNGRIKQKSQCARQVGTSVILSNIFCSLPVRQKEFHKNLKKEFNKMLQLLYAYCLVSSGVKISCTNQTKTNRSKVVTTHGSSSVKENIACVFGSKQVNGLLELKKRVPSDETLEELKIKPDEVEMFSVDGFVSSCAHGSGRGASDRQFFFINSRPCDLPKVSKLVNEVYHQYNVHQYPFVFLNVCATRSDVDVNVTPDKRQIFLNKEKLLLAIIRSSLLATYENIPSTFQISQVTSLSAKDETGPSVQKPSIAIMLSQWRNKNELKRPSDDAIESSPKKRSFQPDEQKISNFVPKTIQSSKNPAPVIADESTEDNQVVLESAKDAPDVPKRVESQTTQSENHSEEVIQIDPGISRECSEENKLDKFGDSNHSAELIKNDLGTSRECLEESDTQENDKIIAELDERPDEGDPIVAPRVVVEVDKTVPLARKTVNCVVTLDQIKHKLSARVQTAKEDVLSIKFRAAIDPKQNRDAEKELNRGISKEDFDKMEIIGQFNLGFIIAKLGSDLFIIDQHASDEKYNFETLQRTTAIVSQNLVVPQPLELTADSETILRHNLDVFTRNGFKFKFEENDNPTKRVFLTAVPLSKNCVFGKKDVEELLFMLQNNPVDTNLCRPSSVRAMFASRACRKSVMIGTALTRKGMKRIVSQMGTIEHPWNCPHGRPTMRHLINLDLVKR